MTSLECQLEEQLNTLGISPRRAMQQIVDYKNDPGNGYTRTLLCIVQESTTTTWRLADMNLANPPTTRGTT